MELECSKFLWDRFNEMTSYFIKAKREKVNACLVIQIYNVEKQVIDCINKFLQCVIFCRRFSYGSNIGEIPSDIPIYVEL